jgi:hypothetical protein
MKTKIKWRISTSFVFATMARLFGSIQHPAVTLDKICLEKANQRAATMLRLRESHSMNRRLTKGFTKEKDYL